MSADRIATLHAIRDGRAGITGAVQRDRMLTALHVLGSLTTFEASRHLDVYDPRARTMELRQAGHGILTVWERERTECGAWHRIGRYVLAKGAKR